MMHQIMIFWVQNVPNFEISSNLHDQVALSWRRGVFAVQVPCPVCKLPFRTSHVGRCDLLSALAASDPNLLEDISVYGHDLPANYCIVDAALNHRAVGGFCFLIERLCLILRVPLDEA